MADNWMNDRDREMRDRDWRRSEQYGRGDYRGRDDRGRESESRSFDDSRFGAQRNGAGRDRVFGERETGANYTRSGGGVTSGGGAYSGGESYGRGAGGGQAQFARQDYTQGGRYYGDDRSEPIYRQEYGQGGVEYGDVPRGYDADRSGGRGYGQGGYNQGGYGQGGYGQGGYGQGGYAGGDDRDRRYGEAGSDRYQANYARAYGAGGSGERYNSGGTGGYDYDRGYGDAGRGPGGRDRGSRFEDNAYRAGQETGDFFQRAGEKISSWFRGDRYMSGSDQDEHRSYREDYGRENNVMFGRDRGHRGRGPKDYKRSDDRITEEVHERLTDDAWLDASNINVAVSDGEVTLTGSVDNRESKHRAERLIEDLSGVKHVQNNLRVDGGSSLTGSGRGFGDNMVDEQVRSYETSQNEGDRGASGLSGRTSTGALAERSTGTAKDGSEDPISGKKN